MKISLTNHEQIAVIIALIKNESQNATDRETAYIIAKELKLLDRVMTSHGRGQFSMTHDEVVALPTTEHEVSKDFIRKFQTYLNGQSSEGTNTFVLHALSCKLSDAQNTPEVELA